MVLIPRSLLVVLLVVLLVELPVGLPDLPRVVPYVVDRC
jgi:hypothetical protein